MRTNFRQFTQCNHYGALCFSHVKILWTYHIYCRISEMFLILFPNLEFCKNCFRFHKIFCSADLLICLDNHQIKINFLVSKYSLFEYFWLRCFHRIVWRYHWFVCLFYQICFDLCKGIRHWLFDSQFWNFQDREGLVGSLLFLWSLNALGAWIEATNFYSN